MIRKWLSAKHKNTVDRNKTFQAFGDFEQLEEKRCLAFLGFFNGVTLTLQQTADDGDVVVENTGTIWRAIDNASTYEFNAATNVTVEMLDNTVNKLDVQVIEPHAGDIKLELGDGAREVAFSGPLNEIGGDVIVEAGADSQLIDLSPEVGGVAMIVHGSARFDLGEGVDEVTTNGQLLTVDVDLDMSGVNIFSDPLFIGLPGPPPVPGNVTIDNSMENQESVFSFGGTVHGTFTYTGGVNIDSVNVGSDDTGTAEVIGDVIVHMGDGVPFFGNPQNFDVIAGSIVRGDIVSSAGESDLGNNINFLGQSFGNIISYDGGDTVDTVVYEMLGDLGDPLVSQVDVFITLGGGDDLFTLVTAVNLLEIDFGNDFGDVFDNQLGAIDFEFDFTNFHFFDHFYTALNDTLVMNQLADVGDIRMDNDGGITGFDWQTFIASGAVASTARSENLKLNLLDNTNNNLEMDLFNPVLASIEINAGDGDRNIDFTGLANNPLRDININAGAGDQAVNLSVNNPLGVATLAINLGEGFDTVDDNANNLTINEDLILIGVNNFQNDGVLIVSRDFVFDSTVENSENIFANNQLMVVGEDFTYLGGDGKDTLLLNGAVRTEINGTAIISMGDSINGDEQLIDLDHPETTFKSSLAITSTSELGDDVLTTNAGTEFEGPLSVDLGDGINNVDLIGVISGSPVSYTGGDGVDTVRYGLGGVAGPLSVSLGADDDSFELLAGSAIASPFIVDFGPGNDTFTNSFGEFTFDATLNGLNGFNHSYTNATKTLVSTQILDMGPVNFDNGAAGEAVRVTDSMMNASTLTKADNLTINLLGSTQPVNVRLDNDIAGNLELNLSNGSRTASLNGSDNTIGGDLTVTGGNGSQTVLVASANDLTVGGSVLIDLGIGNDMVDESGNQISVGSDFTMVGVNTFLNNAAASVGGDLLFDVSGENVVSTFSDNSPLAVAGSFTYEGSDANDNIIFDTTTNISGPVTINAGGGLNTSLLVNMMSGPSVTYNGGNGVDLVTYGMTGSLPALNINLMGGDDIFTLNAGATFANPLNLDFGDGADSFVNNYGQFDFDANLMGLNGFNHSYTDATGTLVSTQVEDLGPVVIDNDGILGAVQFDNGGAVSTLTPVDNLTVNLLDGSASLDVNLNNAHGGDLSLDVGNGGRNVTLGGTMNMVGGNLNVVGGDGTQTLAVAPNQGLTVDGNVTIDLGDDVDTLAEEGNGITVGGDLNLAAVNLFTNTGILNIGNNFNVDNTSDSDNATLNDSGAMTVGGVFDYQGGTGRDVISFESASSTSIAGGVDINLGDNTNTGTQDVSFGAPLLIGGDFTVASSNSVNDDSVSTAVNVGIGGNVDIDLGGGDNELDLRGIFTGSTIEYNGEGGEDDVTIGTVGNDAAISADLGQGVDVFTLLAGTDVESLDIQFGDNGDVFNNLYGDLDFNASLSGVDGFNHDFDAMAESLVSTQISDRGDVTVDNNGANNAIRFSTDSTTSIGAVNNLRVNMLDDSGSKLDVNLDNAFSGDLTLDLGNGVRSVVMGGSSNQIDGEFDIIGGSGSQSVTLAADAPLEVTGNLDIDLRAAADSITDGGNGIVVDGDLNLTDVNVFTHSGSLTVAGDVNVDNSQEDETSRYSAFGASAIGGAFTYDGGDLDDSVTLGGTVAGDVNIELADNTGVGSQTVFLNGTTDIGGNTVVTSSADQGQDVYQANSAAVFGGDLTVNLGDGSNQAVMLGELNGTAAKFTGGTGNDNVTYGMSGTPTNPNIKLRSGDDTFVLQATASINNQLRVDFGGGNDSFNNNFGAFTFNANLLNWQGYNRFFDVATSSLNMIQTEDTGDVMLDNNGSGGAWRLTGDTITEMTASNSARLILMDGSSTNVTVDLDSAVVDNLTLQLRGGERQVSMIGSNNTVGGQLRIEASEAVQTINLAVNANLTVENLVINGRNGSDTVLDNGNDINVGDAMILRGVNNFTNSGNLTIGGDFNVITSLESENTTLGNTGNLNLAGNLTYIGGGGIDRILFNTGGVSIGGFSYFDIATSIDAGAAQQVNLLGGFTSNQLVIRGLNSLGGNEVVTDANTNISGDVVVNFAASATQNSAVLLGTYTGSYSTYRGGNGVDNVVLGAVAPASPMVIFTGVGVDTLTVEASTDVLWALVDFGPGNDNLIDNLGMPYSFPTTILNL